MIGWIGIALLSASWLFGLDYYRQADRTSWAVLVVIGTLLLAWRGGPLPGRRESLIALTMTIPAAVLAPWPFNAAPLAIAAGLALHAAPILPRRVQGLSGGGIVAGCILLAQGLALTAYEALTARSHELPAPLPELVASAAKLFGIHVTVHETTLAVHSMRKEHMLGATWELLLDPATLCFLIGGTVLVLWDHGAGIRQAQRRWQRLRTLGAFLVATAMWLPVRAALLMALYLHDVLRTDYDAALDAMTLFWNPWLHLSLLAGPLLLAWRCVPGPDAGPIDLPASAAPDLILSKRFAAAGLALAAAASFTFATYWDPVGERQPGRVIVEEYHPEPEKIWERTDKPFDTEWYGQQSGYNYYCIYDYCSRFYEMSRLTQPIDGKALSGCDVLVVKVPTRPYSEAEVRAVVRFVERGGGLLLIGEHTNVFRSSNYLNAIAHPFGFSFRDDCLFGIESVFEQRYDRPLIPHPILQHMPPLDFATSCSIDPAESRGRAVIRDTGLKSLGADYHADNYYPQPEDAAEMRYGAFVQLWSMRYGRGRVAAFTDSTIFSNFSAFEPGKAELMLGMLEWLNHRTDWPDPRMWLIALGLAMLFGAVWVARTWPTGWLLLLAAGLLGWAASVPAIRAMHQAAMPFPPRVRPMVEVVLDRSVCEAPLPTNGFISGEAGAFGIFERSILRLGYFTSRRTEPEVFRGDLIIFPYPSRLVTEEYRDRLVNYVSSGGKVLVLDSPENERSTANELLNHFGLSVNQSKPVAGGTLTTTGGLPAVPIASAVSTTGGQPFASIEGTPVGTWIRHGQGSVTIVGFGSRFSDAQMGVTGDVIPTEDLKPVFELVFSMLRDIIGQPAEAAP